jgi:CheY-like chemotaxis protein
LLTFSRKQVMERRPLDLNVVVKNLTKMLTRIIGENILLECAYDAKLPAVHADVGMIEQVLVNLVVNARDAMIHGGQLRITTEQAEVDEDYARSHLEAHSGRFVCLRIRDTGTGIAPEHLPHIFEPFFTTKQPGKGTGLGLATVHGIVTQHQGWAEVSPQAGGGTTFKILLPAVPQAVAEAESTSVEPVPRGTGERILLVEDDLALRALTRQVLETSGYEVWETATGEDALKLWRDHCGQIDLLLTDIIMPGALTGRELADQLRQERPGLKMIFITGYSPEVVGTDTAFLRRSKRYSLQKPCSSLVLLRTVRQCLDEN